MSRKRAVQSWKDLKFGLFIHWGIYSLLERGEWVMYRERIPVREYEKLAQKFNPVKFDARAWVAEAKRAGMKYIVITAKHHDGFSMFKTEVDRFNIVDATPFARDPLAELAEACREQGIKLGFYYSHVREWRHPMAQSFEAQGLGDRYGNYGNFWDYPQENKKNLQVYLDEFDVPQLRELLTNYGDVLTIWFDTPSLIRPDQAEHLRDLVHSIQPDCLVNGRLCREIETDYDSLGDNEIPAMSSGDAWETAMTMGRGWGYSGGGYFGDAEEMLRSLIDIVSKGGNFLLNVGPDALGSIPEAAIGQLHKVGDWLAVNGEAIYGCAHSPFLQQPSWGRITRKANRLYLTVLEKGRQSIRLAGLLSAVTRCYRLSDGAECPFHAVEGAPGQWEISLPDADEHLPVVALEGDGELITTDVLGTNDDGSVSLPAALAEIQNNGSCSPLSMSAGGVTEHWIDDKPALSWAFETATDGCYRVQLVIKTGFWRLWEFGHEVIVEIDGQALSGTISDDGRPTESYQERRINLGALSVAAGSHQCTVRADRIVADQRVGLTLLAVQLANESEHR